MAKYRIAWLPGDGIGIEVLEAARLVLDRLALDADYVHSDIGWEFWRTEGDAFPPRTIDLLKQVNHDHGPAVGDHLLKSLGELILSMLPPDTEAGRFESDEFMVLMPGMTLDAAYAWAEDCRQRFAALPMPDGIPAGHATLSAGIAGYPNHGNDIEQLIECSSLALFLAKHDGYDRVVTFNPDQTEVF